jgi:hypothetical protein
MKSDPLTRFIVSHCIGKNAILLSFHAWFMAFSKSFDPFVMPCDKSCEVIIS